MTIRRHGAGRSLEGIIVLVWLFYFKSSRVIQSQALAVLMLNLVLTMVVLISVSVYFIWVPCEGPPLFFFLIIVLLSSLVGW